MAEINVIPKRRPTAPQASDDPTSDGPIGTGASERSRRPNSEPSARGQDRAGEAVALVSQGYVYTGSGPESFLREHPSVAQALLDARPEIEEAFGQGVVVSLRVSSDGESDPVLSANIQTRLGVSEARAARKSFYASWQRQPPETEDLPLIFNLDYADSV